MTPAAIRCFIDLCAAGYVSVNGRLSCAPVTDYALAGRVRRCRGELKEIADRLNQRDYRVAPDPRGGVSVAEPAPAECVLAILNMEAEQAKGAVAA
jgi:hypothetical protein